MPTAKIPGDNDLDAMMDALAPLIGLTIEPAWRAPIAANLRVNATLAAQVMDFALSDHDDAAPVYQP
jgi:hypothetical protein